MLWLSLATSTVSEKMAEMRVTVYFSPTFDFHEKGKYMYQFVCERLYFLTGYLILYFDKN